MFSNIYKVLNIALLKQFDKCLLQVKPILFLFKTATQKIISLCFWHMEWDQNIFILEFP